MKQQRYDIVVVGGGHAGIEAALISSYMGASVALITMDPGAIGRMSCNPAIGGLAKGQMVREIDVLGGAMGSFTDKAGIQFKVLNKKKGRAVWSPRAQVDKRQYEQLVGEAIKQSGVEVLQGEVVSIVEKSGAVRSVLLRGGGRIKTSSAIITSGTFLSGVIHIGERKINAGRMGEERSEGLTESLRSIGFKSARLKTGTPPRLDKNSVDWKKTSEALGDENPVPFSYSTNSFKPPNIPCHTIKTNEAVHEIIYKNQNRSPMFSGDIAGTGPRYCPSIEDKVNKFRERDSHILFLEPEWLNSDQIYLNGFSTSLPEEIQLESLRKVDGLESVNFFRPGYAIEYDYFPPSQLKSTLETKDVRGLYFAGQMNGTSGYEEAAAQGLLCGINSALAINGEGPLLLTRDSSYIGVMIDDLITKDTLEPYRMFTSRAEYRLSLRADTAYLRLTEKAYKVGLINNEFFDIFNKLKKQINAIKKELEKKIEIQSKTLTGKEFLLKNKTTIKDIFEHLPLLKKMSSNALFVAETDIKYSGYVKIEQKRVNKIKQMEFQKIPENFNYNSIVSLSNESKQKLMAVRPETLGQASRIDGVRSSDVSLLCIMLKQHNVSRGTL